jgi:hypothetical protein
MLEIKTKNAHASHINPGNRGRKTSPLSTTPHPSPAKVNVVFST